MNILDEIAAKTEEGNSAKVKELVAKALSEKIAAADVLNKGLLKGMEPIGIKFKKNEIFIPEVLIAARAMKTGLEILKPALASASVESKGTIVIGTVKGDLHDIGKNIVGIMLEGSGYRVVDLGIDVTAEQFMEALDRNSARVMGLSALLTTTMGYMKEIVDAVRTSPKGSAVKVIIGGAPVTQAFADEIRADGYSADAPGAVDLVSRLLAG
jgi:5-methyltetrahydrofolate--homocysteine methyltransferase